MTQVDLLLPAAPVRLTDPISQRVVSDHLEHAEATTDERGQEAVSSRPPSKRQPRRLPFWALAIGGTFIATAAYVYVPSLYVVETDDASFQADTISIVPKVAAPDNTVWLPPLLTTVERATPPA